MERISKNLHRCIACAAIVLGPVMQLNGQTTEPEAMHLDSKVSSILSKRYATLAYEHESGRGPNNGFSLGYQWNIGKKRVYYLGVVGRVISNNKTTDNLEWTLQSASIGVSQRVFLNSGRKVQPFIDLDIGTTNTLNYAEIPTVYGARAPGFLGVLGFRYYTGGEETEEWSYNAGYQSLGVGCFFNILRGPGMYVQFGYKHTKSLELIDKQSVGTTDNHVTPDYELGYDTYKSQSGTFLFSLGIMWGRFH